MLFLFNLVQQKNISGQPLRLLSWLKAEKIAKLATAAGTFLNPLRPLLHGQLQKRIGLSPDPD